MLLISCFLGWRLRRERDIGNDGENNRPEDWAGEGEGERVVGRSVSTNTSAGHVPEQVSGDYQENDATYRNVKKM